MRCPRCGNAENAHSAKQCRVCGSDLPATESMSRATARASSNWTDIKDWRRYLLVRLGAPPVEIPEGKEFLLGRSSKADLVVNDPKISRFHAEVFWKKRQPVIRDLGSENGTQVNSKPVREHPLQDGDQIQIGPFVCSYKTLQGRGSIKDTADLADSQADTQAMAAIAMSGKLEEMSMYEILETLAYNQKTGTLEVYGPYDLEGRIIMQEGVALHAEVDKLRGLEAVFGLFKWTTGTFRFVRELDPDKRPNIRMTTQEILKRAAARMAQQQPPDGLDAGAYQSG